MTKTIKDMAIEAYPISKNGAFKQSQMEYEIEIKQKRSAYFNGANAVIKEIEFLLERTALYRDGSDTTILYLELKDLMNELKGE